MILRYFSKSFLLLVYFLSIILSIYVLVVWGVAQTFFPFQANGSLLLGSNNKPIGSKLIAQAFTQEGYFKPRPSAVFYDASASGSSALAVSNSALRERVVRSLKAIKLQNGKMVPGDFVTTSASGLDPDISLQNAEFQLESISAYWAKYLKLNVIDVKNTIERILQENASAPLWGLAGEELLNVLEVNLAIYKQYG